MNPFENIAWKWQAQVESSWGLRCTGPSPLSCYVDLLIYMKTHIHLFMCSTIPFLVKDINYILSAYFIFSHKSTAEIQLKYRRHPDAVLTTLFFLWNGGCVV